MESEAELAFCSGIFRFSGPFPIGEIRCNAIIAAEKMLAAARLLFHRHPLRLRCSFLILLLPRL